MSVRGARNATEGVPYSADAEAYPWLLAPDPFYGRRDACPTVSATAKGRGSAENIRQAAGRNEEAVG
jgi:hypothetical protein